MSGYRVMNNLSKLRTIWNKEYKHFLCQYLWYQSHSSWSCQNYDTKQCYSFVMYLIIFMNTFTSFDLLIIVCHIVCFTLSSVFLKIKINGYTFSQGKYKDLNQMIYHAKICIFISIVKYIQFTKKTGGSVRSHLWNSSNYMHAC